MTSVFEEYGKQLYDRVFAGTIHVHHIVGGTPTDPKVAEGWIRSKIEDKDDIIRDLVLQTMMERGVDEEVALKEVDSLKHLNGFKRDDLGLYIEDRHLKACLKEASNIRWPKRRWGPTNKGTKSYLAEHLFITPRRLHFNGISEPTGIQQRFVHTFRGTGIQYEEYVEGAEFDFTITSDVDLTDDDWGELWSTAERQGIGATRSQGFGVFDVVRWERL